MFGENADVGPSWSQPGIKVITADFLQGPCGNREILRIWDIRKKHSAYKQFLKGLGTELIVTGLDWDSIGKWTAVAAKDIGIATLGCQEGGRIANPHISGLTKLKTLAVNFLCLLIYRQYKITNYFGDSLFYAVWGEYDKSLIVSSGFSCTKVFIVGDPRIQARNPPGRIDGKFNRMLFLDVPSRSTANKRFDLNAIDWFRKQLISETKRLGIEMLYKLHPFTKPEEIALVNNLIADFKNVTLVKQGAAEDYYAQVDFCLTFPSTSIYTVLAFGLPLVIIAPRFKGFEKQLMDPVKAFGAGVTVTEPQDLARAVETMKSSGWHSKYLESSKIAAEYMSGPPDGKASIRFASVVDDILDSSVRHE